VNGNFRGVVGGGENVCLSYTARVRLAYGTDPGGGGAGETQWGREAFGYLNMGGGVGGYLTGKKNKQKQGAPPPPPPPPPPSLLNQKQK
jgi:hypothetical protein